MSPGFIFTMWCFLCLRLGAALPVSPGRGGSWSWGCGCACREGLHQDRGDLDPGDCAALCHRKGLSVSAVTSQGCYCENQELLTRPSSDCLGSSTHGGQGAVLLLPVGEGDRNVALYQTSGGFLDRISLSVSPDLVFTNTTFTVHISGNLAAPLDQSTGISGFEQQALSDVTVEFLGMTPKGQSSHHVSILDHGSFNVSSNWSFEAPGTYEIRVIASNILSMITATLNLTVLAKTPDGLVKVWPRVDSECDWCLTQGGKTCLLKSTCIQIITNTTVRVRVKKNRESFRTGNVVEVSAAKQSYPTNTEVHFSALTDAEDSMEFLWHFGDSTSARNMFKTITKKYSKPGRYNVTVVMVTPRTSTTSAPFPIIIQRAVKLNRLVHQASVLQDHTAVISCRVNTGSDLNFLWTFGDGSSEHGQSTVQHVFQHLGEFAVEVTVFNLVSSASLKSHVFVVDTHCQPPPVKNMGPLTVKVTRYEPISLGVTYGSNELNCDVFISGGIQYIWTLYNSTGQVFPLPHIETHRQILELPRHFLHYNTYTAIAKVKVVGSVVHSNYSVKLQVIETAPVAVIQCGTNVFINNKNTTVVTLDGTKSYDPDFPHNTARFIWTCKPLSTISSSCFDHEVPMSLARIYFPASFLKQNFDQFQFTLTIESAGRSASSEVFITVKTGLQGKLSVACPQCQNDKVNWDQPFSVQAFCEQCKTPSNLIHFFWSLYQVNASSRPVNEVPFCYAVDLSAPSSIKDTSTETSVPAPYALRRWRSVLEPGPDSSGDDLFDNPPEDLDPLFSSPYPSDYSGHVHEIMDPFESSTDWEFPFPVKENAELQNDLSYDPLLDAEEGESEISPGRTTVGDGESFSLGEDSEFDPESHREEGSNLVNVRPHVMVQERTLLDLPRDPVPRSIFESYTYTGISSSHLDFKPFTLRPGSRYMLDVIATQTHDPQEEFVGRTQFFFQTKPVPKGMMCQVQPTNGVELLTVFSVFCTSGKADFWYKYSFSVGNKPPQTLYQGADFEHYFNLPAGDPNDDYKVTVSIEIRSSIDGGTTRPCPVTVKVRPQFVIDTSSTSDPVLNLSQIVLRNLSRRLGNSLNYVRIVTNLVNRLSLEPGVNTLSLIFLRNALVCIVCDIKTIDQFSILDTIHLLQNLLEIPNQITLASISKVTGLVHFLANQLSVDQKTLNNMISLLSHKLKAVMNYDYQNDISVTETQYNLEGNNAISSINVCLTYPTGSLKGLSLAKHLVNSILHIISVLSLKCVLLNKIEEFKLNAGLVSVFATYQIQSPTVSSGFCVFKLPQSFVRHLDTCVISVVTELNQNLYFWGKYPGELTGPVVELNLFRCNTRRKIPIQFFAEPFEIEVRPPEKQTVTPEYILQPDKINYHSFNISHEHLQHAIQLRVQFTPPATRVFPVMLLFRMFAKPTPSEYHLRKIHSWERSVIHMTLPSSYLNAEGVGYLALLRSDFKRPRRWRNTKVSYRVRVDTRQCLSWDAHRGAWTDHNCRTHTADTSSNVSCSCHQLHPVTLRQEQISSNLVTEDIGALLNVSQNWTVVVVLVLGVAFYTGALVLSQNADVVSGDRKVHYLSDNLPCETYLYAVTLHTGLCSAAEMSANVYIVLCGENGFTQTKELQVPGCTLFRRNSQDTFIVSAAESLGSLCGIYIWHDNSGPTPAWYLKCVEVFELNRDHHVKGRSWLFDSRCWFAVNKSDGRVERTLRVCNEKMGFGKMLRLKVWDCMPDFHIWISLYSCPNSSSFTQRQRLSVCVLLWLGYACVSTLIISQTNDKMHLELDIKDLSMNAVTTGMLSVALVLPVATFLSFMFRLSQVKIMRPAMGTGEDAPSMNNTMFDLYLSWSGLQQWAQESWRKKYQETDLSTGSSRGLDDKILDEIQNNVAISKEDIISINGGDENHDSSLFAHVKKKENVPNRTKGRSQEDTKRHPWCDYVAWGLWLLICMSCLVSSAVFGGRFNHREAVLWIQSLFFALLFCIVFIHPLLVCSMALVVSLWRRKSMNISHFSTHRMHKSIYKAIQNCTLSQTRSSTLLKLLETRQRRRFLHLVHPPTLTELRKSRRYRKREMLIHQTMWDWFVFASMLSLMLCVTYGSSSSDYYNLNRAVKKHFISEQNSFMCIRTYDDWWKWAQSRLIDALYKNTSVTAKFATFENPHILIGEPVLWKAEAIRHKDLNSTLLPNCHHINLKKKTLLVHTCSNNFDDVKMATREAKTLGHTKTIAESKLKQLHTGHWVGKSTVVLKVHFVLYSPAPNLFTSVTLTIKPSPFGVLLPSANVQSVQVFHTVSKSDYVVMTCKLLFLILLFLRLCHHILSLGEKGLLRHSKSPCNCLEVGVFVVAMLYYIYGIYRTPLVSEIAELLQRQNSKTHIDFCQLATWDQTVRSLCGTLLFLLTLRCASLVNKTTPPIHSMCSLLWILIAAIILLAPLSSMVKLVYVQNCWVHIFFLTKAKIKNSRGITLYHDIMFVLARLVWAALAVNVLSSSGKCLRRRRTIFSTGDLVQYIKNKLFSIWTRSTYIDQNIDRKTYHFEQFESVLDELLFKLDVLSESDQTEAYRNDSPILPSQDSSKIDTQDFLEPEIIQSLSSSCSETSGPDELSYLPPKGRRGDKISECINLSNKVHQNEIKCNKNTGEREVEMSKEQCTLTSSLAKSSEVQVKVLVHKEQVIHL